MKVLTASGRMGAGIPAGEWAMGPLAASVLLHGAVAAALLLRVELGRGLPVAVPPLEVELVQQPAQVQGAPASATARPAPPSPPAPLSASPPAPPPPPSATAQGGVPPAPPAPAQRPSQARPAEPPPEVNLGDAAEAMDPLAVTSKDVLPPAPDSRFRNLPPHYPAEAARIGAEGIVQLLIHVTTAGLPGEVLVAHSSGFESLDREARRAVLLWRFQPARNAGQAVPYDYLLNIRFAVGDSK